MFLGIFLIPIVILPLSVYGADPERASSIKDGWLGVTANNLSFEELDSRQLEYGVSVVNVTADSPADKVGIETQDIIVELNNKPVYSVNRLQWIVRHSKAGDDVRLKYYRDGHVKTVDVTLESWQARMHDHPFADFWRQPPSRAYLGFGLQSMPDELREHFGAPEGEGVLITQVDKGSPAEELGLVAGDVVIKMDRKTIRHISDVHRVLNFFDPGEEMTMEIIHDKQRKRLKIVLEERPESSKPSPPFLDPQYWQEELEKLKEQWGELWRDWSRHQFESPQRPPAQF